MEESKKKTKRYTIGYYIQLLKQQMIREERKFKRNNARMKKRLEEMNFRKEWGVPYDK